MRIKNWIDKQKIGVQARFRRMIKCICSGEQLRADELIDSSESLATRDYSASGYSSRAGEMDTKLDNSNIEEAESSLRESGYLNYEEARALLGRLEFQKGNIEAALQVFEGIDVAAVISKIKATLSRRCEQNRRRSQSDASPSMSMHAATLLLEAIFLKAKSLQGLGRYEEAAQSCKVILDTVENALPEGLPEIYSVDCKLQETLNKAVELLPELWKLAGSPQETILSYRRALLYNWNLEEDTTAKIEKEFAVFLLYSGTDACPPNLRSQMEGSFVPRNNIEEAVLLLLILLRKFILRRIGWDPSILDHLSFALSVSGELWALAYQIEELFPGVLERKERYCFLALCYYGEGEPMVALNLLRNLLNNRDNSDCMLELLLASKICVENMICIQEGMTYARKALSELHGRCDQMASLANGGNESQANTNRIVGTYGYMSPEYAIEGIFSIKSDVFSFGVLLLEIVSGKKNTGFYQTASLNLLGYAWDMWTSDKGLELKDPVIEVVESSNHKLIRYVNIGLLCVQESAEDRPTMSDVVSMLHNETAPLPPPKEPAFSHVRSSTANSDPPMSSSSKPDNCSVNNVTVTLLQAR